MSEADRRDTRLCEAADMACASRMQRRFVSLGSSLYKVNLRESTQWRDTIAFSCLRSLLSRAAALSRSDRLDPTGRAAARRR